MFRVRNICSGNPENRKKVKVGFVAQGVGSEIQTNDSIQSPRELLSRDTRMYANLQIVSIENG